MAKILSSNLTGGHCSCKRMMRFGKYDPGQDQGSMRLGIFAQDAA